MSVEPESPPPFSWRGPDGRLLRRGALLAIGTFVAGFLLAALWMWAGSNRGGVATVPNLREMTQARAERALDGEGLSLELGDSLPHPEVGEGLVLAQSPLPGREVAPGSAVQVILSSGPQRHAVPRVAGMPREQAEQLLSATGMTPTIEEVEDSRRAGRVVGTLPEAGTVLAVPSPVRLLISRGPPRTGVPYLLGRKEGEIGAALDSARLRLGQVDRELRIYAIEGEILSQRPSAGDSVPVGTAVDLVVATQRLEFLPQPGNR